MAAVGHAQGASNAETALGKIDAVANGFTDAIKRNPIDEGVVNTGLSDHFSDQTTDGIVGKRRHHGGAHAEASAQTAGDVVFTPTLPGAEMTGGMNAFFPRVKPEHDFPQGQTIIAATFFGFNIENRQGLGPFARMVRMDLR